MSNKQPKEIHLGNLSEATQQEVFDHVSFHLLTQNKVARCNVTHGCQYRMESMGTILKCAAGSLITKEQYKVEFESLIWPYLNKKGLVPSAHSNFIDKLQMIHDSRLVSAWKEDLKNLAKENSLNTAVLDQFN